MSTYVISDIHGCYKEFLSMLDKISFSDADQLLIAGDSIDRGPGSYEMLKWIEQCPPNVLHIRGNHEQEFAAYIDLLIRFDRSEGLETDMDSNEDALALYETIKYYFKSKKLPVAYFDLYGTIGSLLRDANATLADLCRWSVQIRKMPYYFGQVVGGRLCVVAHAGYAPNLDDTHFYLYAREESCQAGGICHGMVVAGHTPTIAKGEFCYNKGDVFRHYDKEKDCVYYDIDCGCVFRGKYADAKLACLRLEDEKVFYLIGNTVLL